MNETFMTVLSIVSAVCAIVFGYLAFVRNRDKDKEGDAKADATVLTEIGYIKGGIDDIKAEQREQRKTNTGHKEGVSGGYTQSGISAFARYTPPL